MTLWLGSLESARYVDGRKKKKKSDSYFLRICGSQIGIFWEYFGNILRILRSEDAAEGRNAGKGGNI